MDDLPDLEIRRTDDEPPPPEGSGRHTGVWIVVALLVVAAGAALYYFRRSEPMAPGTSARPAAATPGPQKPLGGQPEPIDVPPLGDSDPVVRSLVRGLSSAPAVAAWLATNDLIRNFTAVVAGIADGSRPQRLLSPLQPSSGFQTIDRGGATYVDPRSYARYDAVADAVASIDPAAGARVYATLKPRIAEAYGELGLPDPSFDHVLERAVARLLATPVSDAPAALKPKGIGYAYVDDRLENLSAAQKQLLRMGPRNARVIQEKLRAVGIALGIPPDQLPSR